jgi:hypothetical protein
MDETNRRRNRAHGGQLGAQASTSDRWSSGRCAVLLLGAAWCIACGGSESITGDRPDGSAAAKDALPDRMENGDAGPSALGPYPFDKSPSELLLPATVTPSTWQWIDIPGSACRDGSEAGFHLRVEPNSPGVLIMLGGGGVCHDALTCILSPTNATGTSAALWEAELEEGILGEGASNPMRTWTRAFVPHCTGDLHGGTRTDVDVCVGGGCPQNQQFVGHKNMELFLHVLGRYFEGAEKVVLAGSSFGGFGTLFNFENVALAFPNAAPTLINDSGATLPDNTVLSTCLETHWRELYGLDEAMPEGCAACKDTRGIEHLGVYLAATYPSSRFGLLSAAQDTNLISVFGTRVDPSCNMGAVGGSAFRSSLLDLRTTLGATGKWSSMIVNEQGSVYLSNLGKTAGGKTVSEWTSDLLAGELRQLGP